MEPLWILAVLVLTQSLHVSETHRTICQKEQILLSVNLKVVF